MADRSRTVWKLKRGIYEAAEFGEVTVTGGVDSFTIGSFIATKNPYSVTMIKETDGSAVACTYAAGTNVVTVVGGGTNEKCLYMAYGVKA